MPKQLVVFTLALFFAFAAKGQFTNKGVDPEKENILRARTKQVTQFIRRFNSEEGPNGQKYSKDDPDYRNPGQRMKYMPYLFDETTGNYTNALKKEFLKDAVKDETPVFLDFHDDEWFAEVNASFTYKGEQQDILLFLDLEKERKGYKWVLKNVYFKPMAKKFRSDTSANDNFLHPLSHEVDFMNLKDVFSHPEEIQHYADKDYEPDYLTLFFYELKNANLQFRHVKQVKFHFLQVKDWYFELSYVERQGRNAGWLITNLIQVPEDEKAGLEKLIQVRH